MRPEVFIDAVMLNRTLNPSRLGVMKKRCSLESALHRRGSTWQSIFSVSEFLFESGKATFGELTRCLLPSENIEAVKSIVPLLFLVIVMTPAAHDPRLGLRMSP